MQNDEIDNLLSAIFKLIEDSGLINGAVVSLRDKTASLHIGCMGMDELESVTLSNDATSILLDELSSPDEPDEATGHQPPSE